VVVPGGLKLTLNDVVAWGVVAWFMNWVRHRGFAPFAIYRFALGTAVLVWLLQH
jgi:undecaprenyl-diphosphatase